MPVSGRRTIYILNNVIFAKKVCYNPFFYSQSPLLPESESGTSFPPPPVKKAGHCC